MDNFEKCGEITISVRIGQKYFAFNCLYCPEVYLHIDEFATHIEENHYVEVFGDEDNESRLDKFENDSLEELSEDSIQGEVMDTMDNEEMSVECQDEKPIDSSNLQLEDSYGKEDSDDILTELYENSEIESKKPDADLQVITDEEECNDDVNLIGQDVDEEEVVLLLLDEYKKNSVLWHPSKQEPKYEKNREEALKLIAKAIRKQFNIVLSTKSICELIKRVEYRLFRGNQKRTTSKRKPSKGKSNANKLTLSDKPATSEKVEKEKNSEAATSEDLILPLPDLSDAENIQFIDIYQSFPCLWNVCDIGYRLKTQRIEAIEEMTQTIQNQMELNLTQNEVLNKVHSMQYACTQEKQRQLDCERRGEEFTPSCKYFERMSFLIDNVGPFKCDYCEDIFNRYDQYRIHKSQHDGSKPFMCTVCNKGFAQAGNATVHMRRHVRDFPFECKMCAKRFATTTEVNVHMRSHTGEKPYCCDICGQSFRTCTFFKSHWRRHHNIRTCVCNICSKSFYENNKLNEHMKIHLNVRDKVCNECGKGFNTAKYLRQHKQIHADDKKYVCKICKKAFAQYAGLSGHMKSHNTNLAIAADKKTLNKNNEREGICVSNSERCIP